MPARDVAQLVERRGDLAAAPGRARALASGSPPSRCSAGSSSSERATSRCCAPSCRLRSSRWRSFWPASITRERDPRSSSSARLQLDVQASVLERDAGGGGDGVEQLGLVVQGGVVHERRHVRSVAFDQRRRPPAARLGSSTGRPSRSAQLSNWGSQYASVSDGSPSARASASRRSDGAGSARSSTKRSPDGRCARDGREEARTGKRTARSRSRRR